jgi:CheY-like chemotaxis protein
VPRDEVAELRRRLSEEARSSAEKTRFIRHVSHEFRTPLSSIIGYSALLEREGERLTAEERAEYLGVVLRNARHLLHVANDLLNISKVEAGTLEVTLGPVRVEEMARAVAVALGPQAEERGVAVRLEDGGAPAARADSGRLRQVLFNLLENAIKYSPPGTEVVIRTRAADGGVRLEVADRGPGIAPADQLRLFKEFSRVNPPGMRVVGAGLGLALSRMLAEAMGGRIGVESAPGRGSTFWLALPATAEPGRDEAAPPPAAAARRREATVAVVEDDADLRAYTRAVLARAGYRVVEDAGAPGAGERVAAARPALVLLDLDLAGRPGGAVLAELRRAPEMEGVPVLAFTAAHLADPGAEGYAGRIGKPVEPDTLLAQVDAALDGAAAACGDKEEDFLAPLRARFVAGLAERRAAVTAARAAGDREALWREVHKLRGAAAGYGFEALSAAAGAAQEALRAGEGGAEAALDTLLTLLEANASIQVGPP